MRVRRMISAKSARLMSGAFALLLAASLLSLADAPPSTKPSSRSVKSGHKAGRKGKKPARVRGQKNIDSERVGEIQEALVREHYMSSEPTGKWDRATQEAMRRYQADQGWQARSVPDSRALIRLGLGPDHMHLLNPETAMTSGPRLPPSGASSRVTPDSDAASSPAPNSTPIEAPLSRLSGPTTR